LRGRELAQSIGYHNYVYRIYSASTGTNYENIFTEADAMHAPMVVAETKSRNGGYLPMEMSFVALEGKGIAFSGIKKASRCDSLIIRLFNPTEIEQAGKLTFAIPVGDAAYVDLNEKTAAIRPEYSDNQVRFSAAPKKIVTISVNFPSLAQRPT
jgi:alpha-mannosidase